MVQVKISKICQTVRVKCVCPDDPDENRTLGHDHYFQ